MFVRPQPAPRQDKEEVSVFKHLMEASVNNFKKTFTSQYIRHQEKMGSKQLPMLTVFINTFLYKTLVLLFVTLYH